MRNVKRIRGFRVGIPRGELVRQTQRPAPTPAPSAEPHTAPPLAKDPSPFLLRPSASGGVPGRGVGGGQEQDEQGGRQALCSEHAAF